MAKRKRRQAKGTPDILAGSLVFLANRPNKFGTVEDVDGDWARVAWVGGETKRQHIKHLRLWPTPPLLTDFGGEQLEF